MKKIFFIIIAVIAIILFFNMYGTFAYQSNQSKPYIDFKKKIDISQLFDYRDPTYGYTISYPDFFEHEDHRSATIKAMPGSAIPTAPMWCWKVM